jgi:hypothetical protein
MHSLIEDSDVVLVFERRFVETVKFYLKRQATHLPS